MKISIFFIVGILSLVSCSGLRHVKPVSTTQLRDSVHKTVTYIPRDTTVIVPADSVFISSLISELSESPILKKSNRVTASLRRVGNRIEAECNTDELSLEIEYQDKIIEIYREHQEQTNTLITNTVKYIPKAVKLLAWIGGGLIAVFVGGIALKLLKII